MTRMQSRSLIPVLLAAFLFAFGALGCGGGESEGTMEEAGEAIDEAGEAVEEAAEDTGEAVEETEEAVDPDDGN